MRDLIGSWQQLFAWTLVLVALGLGIAWALAAGGLGQGPALLVMLGLPLLGYALIALAGRSGLVTDVFVAGRAVPAGWNGLALAAQWATGAVFFGYVGLLFGTGHEAFALATGWSVGFLLMGVLLAPYLNKSGALTVPDFLGRRYGGAMPRALAMLVIALAMMALLTAGLMATGQMAARVLGPHVAWMRYEIGVTIALGALLVVALSGGMRSVSLAQAAQGLVLLAGFLACAAWASGALTGMPVPQLGAAELAGPMRGLEETAGIAAHLTGGATGTTGAVAEGWSFTATALAAALATAAMPPLLSRFFAVPTVGAARRSAAWGLLFALALIATAPALAILARFAVLDGFAAAGGAMAVDAIPGWMARWGQGPGPGVLICGAPAGNAEAVAAACGGPSFGFSDVFVPPSLVMLALPEIVGIPFLVEALLFAGGLAALLSSLTGYGLTLGTTLGQDLFAQVSPEANAAARVSATRIFVVVGAGLAAYLALTPAVSILEIVGWALSLMAAALFPALVLAVWDERSTGAGVSAAIVTGAGLTVLYILLAGFGPDMLRGTGDEAAWLGVDARAAAVFGAPAGFLAGLVVSRLTPGPDPATLDFIEEMRVPRRFSRSAEF